MIYLDIETLQQDPYPWMVRAPDDLRPPKNYKDADKIAEWRAEKLASQETELREQSSLEPLLGGVVLCVGVAVEQADPVVLTNDSGDETGERALLAKLERGLCSEARARLPLVSWYGAYDWSFIAKRAVRHGLWDLAGRMLPPKPWGGARHIDARDPWVRCDSRALSRQVDVARYLGIEVHDDVSGSQVSALWAAGERDRVIAHCRSDVVVLREIVRREVRAGWLPQLAASEEGREPPVVPPPRGSVEDLWQWVHRLDPSVPYATHDVKPGSAEHIAALRAMLVRSGVRP